MTRATFQEDTSGPWGPVAVGGRRRRTWARRVVVGLVLLVTAGMLATVGTGALLVRKVESNLTRVPVTSLEKKEAGRPLNVLVVGSDSRSGLTAEEARDLTLGTPDAIGGQRSDTMMLVSITPDRRGASVVSLPRDLLVVDDGRRRKLTETFARGPDHLIDVITANLNVPIHHYAEVSVTGFMGVVETLGSIELCLDAPLRDRKSGADLPAGCQELTPAQALAYVRSRQGARGDFERMERQQRFLEAMLDRLVETRTLIDLPKLFGLIEDVAQNVTTDDDLGIREMRTLAEEVRGLANGSVPMTFLPGYTRTIDGKSYVVAYEPGARALLQAIREGRVLRDRGSRAGRADVDVVVWTGDRLAAADTVLSTLHWSGFRASEVGAGEVDGTSVTTVYASPGSEEQAGWVAATLGAPLEALPADLTPPAGVVVVVGDDAAPVSG